MAKINWNLIESLSGSHPLLNPRVCDCHNWCGEINGEAVTSHHLLDLIAIPHGTGYDQNLDARVYQAVLKVTELSDRIDRIAGWHVRETGPGGTVGTYCVECGASWPCDTRRIADGTHESLVVNEDESC